MGLSAAAGHLCMRRESHYGGTETNMGKLRLWEWSQLLCAGLVRINVEAVHEEPKAHARLIANSPCCHLRRFRGALGVAGAGEVLL